jgi:hypothetical protein
MCSLHCLSSSGHRYSHPLRSPCRSSLQCHRGPSFKHRRASAASILPLLPRAHALSAIAAAVGVLWQPASPRRVPPLEARRSVASRLPRELVRTDAILAGWSRCCRSPLPLHRSSSPPSYRHSDVMPRCSEALGRKQRQPAWLWDAPSSALAGHAGAVTLGREQNLAH